MITATKPTSPLFTSSLDTFTFKISGDTATVTIKCNGMELLSETYYPVSGSITIYDLGTLIADAVRPTVTASFTIDITEHQGDTNIATWSSGAIVAYYATVDIDMSCSSFKHEVECLAEALHLPQLQEESHLSAFLRLGFAEPAVLLLVEHPDAG
jgi:hypothetical protein